MRGDGEAPVGPDARRLVHDLKSPLNCIMGFAALIRDGKAGPVSAVQAEYLDDILTSAHELLRQIEALGPTPGPAPGEAFAFESAPPVGTPRSSGVASNAAPEGVDGPILIVDNDRVARKLADTLLRSHGYRTVCCDSGAAALTLAAVEAPAAVLLDFVMPGMGAPEFIDRFRQLPSRGHVPVIVWTIKDVTAEEDSQLTGADAIVAKRHDGIDQLLSCLRRFLHARP